MSHTNRTDTQNAMPLAEGSDPTYPAREPQPTPHDDTRPADGSKWAFDAGVTARFDDMLGRSIPDYDAMRRLTLDVGSRFVRRDADVVDLGCSRGAAMQPFVDRFGAANRYVLIDESGPMLDAARDRFKGWPEEVVRVIDHDLAEGLPQFIRPSLTLCVLTAMFIPPECRQRLVADVFAATRPGGAMLLVEKTLGETAASDRLLVDTYYDMKRRNGYTQDQVDAKRRSLRGVLMPMTATGNERMLRAEGFTVQPFWRSLNFAGWLAVKTG